MRTRTTRTPEPVPARINTITIRDFRGFCGEAVPAITLHDKERPGVKEVHGKNLLLYGENGSGKSTIFTALKELFDPHSPRHFDARTSKSTCLTNKFAKNTTTGCVALEFVPPAPGNSMEWRIRNTRPTTHQYYDDFRRASGFLDYRAILRTHFLDFENTHINLFPLLVETILWEIELPTVRTTIGEAWTKVLDERTRWKAEMKQLPKQCPTDPFEMDEIGFEPSDFLKAQEDEENYDLDEMYRRFLQGKAQPLSNKIKEFQEQLAMLLGSIQDKANEYLKEFDGFVSIILWDNADMMLPVDTSDLEKTRRRTNKNWERLWRIPLRAEFRKKKLDHPGTLLNEARLTAIALTIYLAALKLEIPAAAHLSATRLLVLDDVLIGLDMTHRLPVLDLLLNEFSQEQGWQVFLFTFDRAWYEVAKQRLQKQAHLWERYEMFAVQIGDYEKPLLVPDEDSLLRARAFLQSGEIKAAAVHIRSKFEAVIKDACMKFKRPISIVLDPKKPDSIKIDTQAYWSALIGATFICTSWREFRDNAGVVRNRILEKEEHRVVQDDVFQRIEHSKSWVMNPLSHDDSLNRYRSEIEDALCAVETLERHVHLAFHLDGKPCPRQDLIGTLTSIIEAKKSAARPVASDSVVGAATDDV